MSTNQERSDRGEAAITFYTKDSDLATHHRKDDEIDRSDVADLISDLCHYLHGRGVDPLGVLRTARENFFYEVRNANDD